jgi:hypothetical protein
MAHMIYTYYTPCNSGGLSAPPTMPPPASVRTPVQRWTVMTVRRCRRYTRISPPPPWTCSTPCPMSCFQTHMSQYSGETLTPAERGARPHQHTQREPQREPQRERTRSFLPSTGGARHSSQQPVRWLADRQQAGRVTEQGRHNVGPPLPSGCAGNAMYA